MQKFISTNPMKDLDKELKKYLGSKFYGLDSKHKQPILISLFTQTIKRRKIDIMANHFLIQTYQDGQQLLGSDFSRFSKNKTMEGAYNDAKRLILYLDDLRGIKPFLNSSFEVRIYTLEHNGQRMYDRPCKVLHVTLPPKYNTLQAIGDTLRNKRVDKGLSMDELTKDKVISKPCIVKLEAGKGGNIQSLITYANRLGLDLDLKLKPR